MARARNIKPGFFRNAELVELPFETRLLFPGLWVIADREGRLEDRPKQIKMELFPADNLDINAMLDQLSGAGLITRYEVNGNRFIQINNFSKHQNPHRDEKASSIPAPCEHSASTVQAQCKEDASSEVVGLIPDSLIPDSLIPSSTSLPEKPAKEKKRASPIPENFTPNENGIDYAKQRGIAVDGEVVSFRNWHTAKGSSMKDWQAAWRTWCDKAVEFGRAGIPAANARASPLPGWREDERSRMDVLTGRVKHERVERDITEQSQRVA